MLEEENRLEFALKAIDDEIKYSRIKLAELQDKGTHLSYEDLKRGDHFIINENVCKTYNKIDMLNRAISSPYFGRMDVAIGNEETFTKYYIGKCGILSNGKTIVTDWRAPVSSLYYDSEIGNVSYEAPQGIVEGKLNLKRKIVIKNSKIEDVQDTNLVTNDDLLKSYLNTSVDNKMKIIIASIQKEQNNIIRKPFNKNLIIQGVAGSGKTSVALHRIAYLIYALGEKISSEQFLIIGPNDYFLNYISSILPDLETSPVSQMTLFSYTQAYINEKITFKEFNRQTNDYIGKKIDAFKTSLEFKDLLETFMNDFMESKLVTDDFKINGETVFTKDKVISSLYKIDKSCPNFLKAYNLLSKELKDNAFNIYDDLFNKYRLESNLDIDKINDIVSTFYQELKKNGSKHLKKYIDGLKYKIIDIYKKFLCDLKDKKTSFSDEEITYLIDESLKTLKTKSITFEDIPSLLYIACRFTKKESNYKYIVIDEAQDYGLFHFYSLNLINKKCQFSIYGDLAQAINSYKSISSWKSVNELIFNNSCEYIELSRSYRTTIEITQNANKVLEHLKLNTATPVIRHGIDVSYIKISNNDNLGNKVSELKQKGYKTIAVICKDEKETEKIYNELHDYGLESKLISNKDSEYTGKLFVLTSAASKGLEFDAVIVSDASPEKYDISSDVDLHLLYVAITRPLHELVIFYKTKLIDVF